MFKSFDWKARHTVLSILFFTHVVSFMDRMAMSVAIPYIAIDYHLSSVTMGLVMSMFFASYAISQVPGGYLADRFGVRRVAVTAMLWWSAFTAITGAAANLTQMLIARLCFGLGEGVFPACGFKTISVWFPKKDRATANGIMLASSAIGTALAPLVVLPIVAHWGWRLVFYSLAVPGVLISLLFWNFITDKPAGYPSVSNSELIEIDGVFKSEPLDKARASPLFILKEINILKSACILFFFDIGNWGYASWLPTYLVKARGLSMAQMGVAASLPFAAGAFGCVLGGWVSDKYFSTSRRTPIVFAQVSSSILLYLLFTAKSLALMMIFQTLAGFTMLFFFGAFWALPMSTVSKNLMGTTSGFINMAGQAAAFISPICIGYLVGASEGNFDHAFMFLISSIMVSCVIVLTISGKSSLTPY